jgi:hypothetical protein
MNIAGVLLLAMFAWMVWGLPAAIALPSLALILYANLGME